MGECKEFAVCACGNRYRCDGIYAKEACPGCLPRLLGFVRRPEQARALEAWWARIHSKREKATAA